MINQLDLREFVVLQSYNYNIILYQAEILRIRNILIKNNSLNLAKKFERMIFLKDSKNDTFTEFDRTPFKGDCANIRLSYHDYNKYITNQREFDDKMRLYYE